MAEYRHIEHSFDPVFDERSRILVLGSFPSVLSRANAFFYGNPQNRFWRVIAACTGEVVPPNEGNPLAPGAPAATLDQSIEAKRALLIRHRIALWDVIESYIMSGRAHELSERHTKLLAACTKGVGHGADLRKQPFSDIPAKQRALSFKPSYVEYIFNNWEDVNVALARSGCQPIGGDSTSVSVMGDWSESESFERHILNRFERFVGMDCRTIEEALCVRINPDSKSYYPDLARAMVGVVGKKRIKEFDQAGITMKTIRLTRNLSSKESMSFPHIRYDRLVDETWDDSDFFEQLDTMFFSPVFQFKTSQTEGVDRRDLVFVGAFFWALGEEDMKAAESVWTDTRDKVRRGEIGGFVSISDDRGFHLRPHGRDSRDLVEFRGSMQKKYCFWINASMIAGIVRENLGGPRSTRSGLMNPN